MSESLFLINLQVSGLQLYLKQRLRRTCFPLNFAKLLKILFFEEHLSWDSLT